MKFLLLITFVSFSLTFGIKAETFDCTDGVLYQENDCNECFCIGGDLTCRSMGCAEIKDNCTHGTSWFKGCNTCWCLKHRGVICTVEECHK